MGRLRMAAPFSTGGSGVFPGVGVWISTRYACEKKTAWEAAGYRAMSFQFSSFCFSWASRAKRTRSEPSL